MAPALAVALLLSAVQEQREVPTFPSRAELVTVDAVVVDRDGRPVAGLTAEDFALSEDGRPQTIVSFEAVDLRGEKAAAASIASGPVATNIRAAPATPSTFVLLLDDMGLAPSREADVRTALARFVDNGLRDGDELLYATTSGDSWWTTRMPEGREDVRALVARLRGRSLGEGADAVSEWEAYRITRLEGRGDAGEAGYRPSQPGQPPSAVAGASATLRVVDRYYQRRICIPDPLPDGGPLTPVSMCRSMVVARAAQVDARRRNRTRDALAAVDRAVFTLTGVRGRKALLLFTEGFLNDPDLDLAREVAGRCREANIAVYSLDVRGLMSGLDGAVSAGTPNVAELAAMQIEQIEAQAAGTVALAEDTGGFAVRNTNDFGGGAARIADESRVYYLIGYAPPEGKGPRDWRRLKVEVKREGLRVRARKGYTLRTAAEMLAAAEARAASASRSASLPAEVLRTLAGVRDVDAIPLRAMAYALEPRADGTVRTVVAVEARMHGLANLGDDDRPYSVLSMTISIAQRDTGKVQRLDQRIDVAGARATSGAGAPLTAWQEGWLTLSREFDVSSGVVQARIVVRDEFLGRTGALTLRFEVPSASGLRLSTPLLTDRVSPARDGGPARPVLIAHRDFGGDRPLYCQFEVFGAAGEAAARRVEASYELRRRDGDVVRRGEPTLISPTADGRLLRLLALPEGSLSPGEYELVLRVREAATGQTRERIEPLRLTAAGPR